MGRVTVHAWRCSLLALSDDGPWARSLPSRHLCSRPIQLLEQGGAGIIASPTVSSFSMWHNLPDTQYMPTTKRDQLFAETKTHVY